MMGFPWGYFGVRAGHGENGEHVAALTMREVPRRLELHPDALRDPARSVSDAMSLPFDLVLRAVYFYVPKCINTILG